jgi:hypothetical protein
VGTSGGGCLGKADVWRRLRRVLGKVDGWRLRRRGLGDGGRVEKSGCGCLGKVDGWRRRDARERDGGECKSRKVGEDGVG